VDLDLPRQFAERNRQSIAEYRPSRWQRSKNAGASARLDPAAHKAQNKTITAEPPMELSEALQVAL